MNELEYLDFLCRCGEFEERNNGNWMDDGWEDTLEQVRGEEDYL